MTIGQYFSGFFKPKPKRLDIRLVTYFEAEFLLKEGWTIAKEEDSNDCIGLVFLEKLEKLETSNEEVIK